MKTTKKRKNTMQKTAGDETHYAHNANYSMIYPDAEKRDKESIVTGSES